MKKILLAIMCAGITSTNATLIELDWLEDSASSVKLVFSGVNPNNPWGGILNFVSPSGLWGFEGRTHLIPRGADQLVMGFGWQLVFDGELFGGTHAFDEIKNADDPELLTRENAFDFRSDFAYGWIGDNFFKITSRTGDIASWEWNAMCSASLPVKNVPESGGIICLLIGLGMIVVLRPLLSAPRSPTPSSS